jgi:hypothetical protein
MKTSTILIGALLIGGGLYLYSQHEKAASAPSLDARANQALATETNPYVLTALANECQKAGRPDLAQLLTTKAQAIFATTHQTPMSGPGGTEQHPAQAILDVAVASPSASAPATLSLAQATLGSKTTLGDHTVPFQGW